PSQTAARQSHDVQLEAVTQELIKRSAHIRAPAEREVIARRESERDGRHQSKRPVLAIAGETGRVSHLDNAFIDGIENLVRWYNRAGRKRFDTHASAGQLVDTLGQERKRGLNGRRERALQPPRD